MLQAALDLLDEVGLDALTVRRLAERLAVQPSALYRHFHSKQALLDAMVASVLTAGPEPAPVDADWDRVLHRTAVRTRAAMLTHRDGARLLITHLIPEAGTGNGPAQQSWANILTVLPAGTSADTAMIVVDTLFAYVNGFTMEEQARDGFPQPPARRAWRDERFRAGLDLIIAGIETTLRAAGQRPRD